MTMTKTRDARTTAVGDPWLKRYYFARAAFSVAWVGLAVALADGTIAVVATLLLIYPAWDAIANLLDARRSGGMSRNPTQAFNAAVSIVTTGAVAIALGASLNAVLGVFGVWAALSGVLQLGTAVRRRKSHGAQWLMIVSGIQSALAGAMFLVQANAVEPPRITAIVPYAAFGAFYFLLSAVWLAVGDARRRRA